MSCQYFNEDFVGFCGATEFSYVPSINEMEQLCFKNFRDCPIYNEFQDNHRPSGKTKILAGECISKYR